MSNKYSQIRCGGGDIPRDCGGGGVLARNVRRRRRPVPASAAAASSSRGQCGGGVLLPPAVTVTVPSALRRRSATASEWHDARRYPGGRGTWSYPRPHDLAWVRDAREERVADGDGEGAGALRWYCPRPPRPAVALREQELTGGCNDP